MRTSTSALSVLSVLTGTGILAQWILVWTGVFPVAETVPGFRNYFLSFAVADMWLVGAAFMTAALTARRDPRALVFGVALGSAMVFFGLYALMYDLSIGVLFSLAPGELFGKAVTLYNLVAGVVFMVLSWKVGRPVQPDVAP